MTSKLQQQEENDPEWLLEGYASKCSNPPLEFFKRKGHGGIHIWKKRYICLSDDRLVCFKSREDIEPCQIVYFHVGTVVLVDKDDLCCFKIERPYHIPLFFRVDTKNVASEWAAQMQRVSEQMPRKISVDKQISVSKKIKGKFRSIKNIELKDGALYKHELSLLHQYTFRSIVESYDELLVEYLHAVISLLKAMAHTSTYRNKFKMHDNVFLGADMGYILEEEEIVVRGKDDLQELGNLLLRTRLISCASGQTEFKTKYKYRFVSHPTEFELISIQVRSSQNDLLPCTDPVVTIEYASQSFNRRWNEPCLIVVHPELHVNTALTVTVSDKDAFLALVSITDPLSVCTKDSSSRWFHLHGKSTDRVERGRINITCRVLGHSYESSAHPQWSAIHLFVQMAEKSARETQQSLGTCLVWTVHGADTELPDDEADLYATITIGHQVYQTNIVYGASSPEWEAEGLYASEEFTNDLSAFLASPIDTMFIEVFNAQTQRFLGNARIHFPQKKMQKTTQWYALTGAAKVQVSMTLLSTQGISRETFCSVAPQFSICCDHLIAPILFDHLSAADDYVSFRSFRAYMDALRHHVTNEIQWRSNVYDELEILEDETLLVVEDERVIIRRVKAQRLLMPGLPAAALKKNECIALTDKALYIKEGWRTTCQRIDLSQHVKAFKGCAFRPLRWWSFTISTGEEEEDRIISFPHVIDSDASISKLNSWMAMIEEVQKSLEFGARSDTIRQSLIDSIRRFQAVQHEDVLMFSNISKETIDEYEQAMQSDLSLRTRLIATLQHRVQSKWTEDMEEQRRQLASAEIASIKDLGENVAVLKTIVQELRVAVLLSAQPVQYVLTWQNRLLSAVVLCSLLLVCYLDRVLQLVGVLAMFFAWKLLMLRNQPVRPLVRPSSTETKNIFQLISSIQEKKRKATMFVNGVNHNALKVRALVLSENRLATNKIVCGLIGIGVICFVVPSNTLCALMIAKTFHKHFEKENLLMKYAKAFWKAAPVCTLQDRNSSTE